MNLKHFLKKFLFEILILSLKAVLYDVGEEEGNLYNVTLRRACHIQF